MYIVLYILYPLFDKHEHVYTFEETKLNNRFVCCPSLSATDAAAAQQLLGGVSFADDKQEKQKQI